MRSLCCSELSAFPDKGKHRLSKLQRPSRTRAGLCSLQSNNPSTCVGDWPCPGVLGISLAGACRDESDAHLFQSTQFKNLLSLRLKPTSASTPLPSSVTCANPPHAPVCISPGNWSVPTATTTRGCHPFCTDAICRSSLYFLQVGWRWVRTCWFPGHAPPQLMIWAL